jgi:acetyl-CoA decarbonylase/synthase delta subunit
MKESPMSEDSDWGAREYRGPLWEVITGMTLAIAGVNMFMMMGPIAVHVLKNMTQTLMGLVEDKDHEIDISNWIREV